jgi:hypothetical protein
VAIPDLTNKNFIDRVGRHKVFGVAVAVVTDNKDPDKLYRVKVRYPWLDNGAKSGGEPSYWARISTIGAGKDRGIYFLPEVEDEVLVAFEHGDMNRPFIVGALWNKDLEQGPEELRGPRQRQERPPHLQVAPRPLPRVRGRGQEGHPQDRRRPGPLHGRQRQHHQHGDRGRQQVHDD